MQRAHPDTRLPSARGARPRPGRSLLRAAAALLAAAAPAVAGTGTIEGGRLDLTVYFAYDEPDPASWIPVFDAYSQLLANATEGQLQLGTVRFTTCDDLADAADVWVLNDFSGARAHLSGLGVRGRHIFVSQLHKSTGGFALGQFGLAHESGHYLFGCYDEYLGYVGFERERSNLHYCTFSNSEVSCLMDGGTTISPNNLRTEFCTPAALGWIDTLHNKGVGPEGGSLARTDQEYFLGRSCWAQIEVSGVGGLLAPDAPPGQGPPLHAPVTYDLARVEGDLALALVVDTSGSMSAEGRLTQAVVGARAGVDLLRDGEFLAIVAFDDVPRVVFTARPLGATSRSLAHAALDGLRAGGGTVIGTAVQRAVDQLALVDGCVELLVIVTDGDSAAPDLDDPAVRAALAAGGQTVYAVAIGSFPDVTRLAQVTAETGGQLFQVASAAEVPGVLATIVGLAGSGTPVVAAGPRTTPHGAPPVEDLLVQSGSAGLRLCLAHAPGAPLDLELVTPAGLRVDLDALPAGVSLARGPGHLTLSWDAPPAGTWGVSVGNAAPPGVPYDLVALTDGPALEVVARARAPVVRYPAPMYLEVSVASGVPAADARVEADVLRPDGSRVRLALHDDGRAVHGDAKAQDGVYSARFARYAGDGAYAFDVEVDGRAARATPNGECGRFGRGAGERGAADFPLEPFTAHARTTALLVGQPAAPAPAAIALARHGAPGAAPVHLAVAPPTVVGGFHLEAGPGRPAWLDGLRLGVRARGADPSLLERLVLHRDADADGRLDVPSVPLAIGTLAPDGGTLRFDAPGASLAFLDAGHAHAFLFTLGEAAPPELRPPAPGRQRPAPQLPGLGGPLGAPPPFAPAGAGLVVAAWLAWRVRRSRPHRGAGGAPVPRTRGLGTCVGLGALILLLACGTRSGPGAVPAPPPSRERVNLELTLAPADVALEDALDAAPVAAAGDALVLPLSVHP